ncbi:MAG: hypothetical protein DRI90_24785, partial [Deltaproteobacteria bacterium]
AGYAAVTAIRRRVPVRQVFNAHTSLLLMLYLLATAALGVFWVARQQLPVFALLEAGVIGERLMLSVVARGLGGCPVGAFYDDEAGQLIDSKRKQLWVLHLAAIGQVAP